MDNKGKISELKTYIKELNELIEIDSRYPFFEEDLLEFDVWKLKTARFIEKFFGKNSVYLEKFKEIFFSQIGFTNEKEQIEDYKDRLKKSKVVLNLILEELEKDLELTKTKKFDVQN